MSQNALVPVDVLNKYPNAEVFEIEGEEMAPILITNDVILVDRDTKPAPNAKDLAVFKLGYQLYVCRYFKYGNQLVMLHETGSPRTVMADQVEVVGKVVWGTYENEESHIGVNDAASKYYGCNHNNRSSVALL